MNDLNKTIIAFSKLGAFLDDFRKTEPTEGIWSQKLSEAIALTGHQNGWHTKENVLYALGQLGKTSNERVFAKMALGLRFEFKYQEKGCGNYGGKYSPRWFS